MKLPPAGRKWLSLIRPVGVAGGRFAIILFPLWEAWESDAGLFFVMVIKESQAHHVD